MTRSAYGLSLGFVFLVFSSCGNSNEPCTLPDSYLEIPVEVRLHRMEQLFFEDLTEEKLTEHLENYPEFSSAMFGNMGFENEAQLKTELLLIHSDSGMQELYEEVAIHFDTVAEIEESLEDAFRGILFHFPEFKVPEVYTFVTGFGTDLIVEEDIIIIGLDYFLPEDHRFQPLELPQYIVKRYTEEHLIPTIVTAISSQFNQTDLGDRTLLAEMIFYGKAYHFAKTILPCTPDEYIIGYEKKEVIGSYANEEMIWGHFIENELLYETNAFEIRRYVGEAPFTDVISPDAPGRIGRWLGWNIVDDYRNNNNLSLSELMQQQDAREIFKLSGYKPR
ncbi:gliding motility-associated lipoprotein GldB [Cyclobacterium xiamenense]|uniref:Gliding motility-associated lipoprotein GldB n=1 Tax=Cyclobacterium xiamenense TaxID=1297121 RepID=A0A1H6WRC7_9BACT|nr:gliding motility lipoprotein GldB [Cyclobacterium xiamenense]SEJ18356.1 gliding motility-associated lipoprotein GldB [Cyclobacterium xiamenense]